MKDFKKKHKVIEVEITKLKKSEYNPNEMSDREFNMLCDDIQENGFVEFPQVVKDGEYFIIVGGHHRVQAAKVLGFERIPVIVLPDEFDEDKQKIQLIRWNMIKGKMNPEKFTKLFDEMAEKYDADILKEMMAFTDEDAFNKVYQQATEQLPPEIKEKLNATKEEITNIDNLAETLNRLFSEYGSTLEYSFMNFVYGGQTHTMIVMSPETKKELDKIKKECINKKQNINDVINEMFSGTKAPKIKNKKIMNDKKQKDSGTATKNVGKS